MKRRFALVAGMIVLCAYTASASVAFRWLNTATGSATDHLGANLPTGFTILTYLSPDATIDFDYGVMLQETYGSGGGQDFLLTGKETGSALAGKYAMSYIYDGLPGAGAGSYVGYYAYFVALELDIGSYTSVGNVAGGTYFDVSTLGTVQAATTALVQYDTDPLAPQQTFGGGTIQTIHQVVPEPGILGLLAVGCCVVGLHRKFRA